jgi:hypothetical protein
MRTTQTKTPADISTIGIDHVEAWTVGIRPVRRSTTMSVLGPSG